LFAAVIFDFALIAAAVLAGDVLAVVVGVVVDVAARYGIVVVAVGAVAVIVVDVLDVAVGFFVVVVHIVDAFCLRRSGFCRLFTSFL